MSRGSMKGTWKALGGVAAAAVLAGGGLAAARSVKPAPEAAVARPLAPARAERTAVVLPAAPAAGPLQAQAQAIVGAGEGWTVMAWSFDRRQPLFSINADKPLIPASNNKVYSAIWALDMLGPDYRFPTDVLVTGPIEGGVLRGDVVLRGSGDPAFGYPAYDKDPLTSPRAMAQALKTRGVRVVEGGVIADATIHDDRNYGPEWPLDTGNGAAQYAPTVSGLPYQRNMLWVDMSGGNGQPYKLDPEVPEIPVVWERRSGRGYAVRKPDEDTVRVRGAAGGRGTRYGVGVAEPAILAGGAFRQALREAGIEVRGPVREGKTPEGATLVHRHLSIPLGDMVAQLNRKSDNFFAEHFWKAAAAKATGQGSYDRGGPASANHFHNAAKVPHGQLWQADGSGLSAQNRTSAFGLVAALAYAHQQPYSQLFHESLAVGGDPGGTMARLFNGTAAEGNLHAKTGYIRGVRSLSGYVKAKNGELIVFSFIYNGRNTSGARGIQSQLGELLANYGG
jgi:serine-type D-Ala-D-Ala carboxypeptidase/endopeptidase (penicillin-binding protein 4)